MAKIKIEFLDYELDKILLLMDNNKDKTDYDKKDIIKENIIKSIDKVLDIKNIPENTFELILILSEFLNKIKDNEIKGIKFQQLNKCIRDFYIKQIEEF